MKPLWLALKFQGQMDRPGSANAWVSLGDHGVDESGWPLVTPSAAGEAEFDGYIDRLHDELEEIRKRGHRKFRDIKRAWSERSGGSSHNTLGS